MLKQYGGKTNEKSNCIFVVGDSADGNTIDGTGRR